jgi:hypothetical protein
MGARTRSHGMTLNAAPTRTPHKKPPTTPMRQHAAMLTSPSCSPGEGIDLIHAIEPAALILERVIREAGAAPAPPLLTSA